MTAPVISGLIRIESMVHAADVLATARHRDRVSQREIAVRLHVTDGAVGLWEQHKRIPPTDDYLAWARAVGFDLALLRRSIPLEDNARSGS